MREALLCEGLALFNPARVQSARLPGL